MEMQRKTPMTAWYDVLPRARPVLSATWSTDEFRERLRAWCEAHVGPITAMRQQKLRGWATVWRVSHGRRGVVRQAELPGPADRAAADGTPGPAGPRPGRPGDRSERRIPAHTRPGPGLHETAGDDLESWVRLAREAALLQRELVPHLRPARAHRGDLAAPEESVRLPRRPDRAVRRAGPRRPAASAPDVADRLRAPSPRRTPAGPRRSAARAAPHPNHNDLHENNVFDVDGRLRFFDFGDSLRHRAARRPPHPAQHPGRELVTPRATTRGCGGWRTPLSRSGATSSRHGTSAPRCRRRSPLGRLGRVESWVRVPALPVRRAARRVGSGRGHVARDPRRGPAGD